MPYGEIIVDPEAGGLPGTESDELALQKQLVPECDLCGRTDGVRRYRIEYSVNPRRLTVDLCSTHRKPLERIAEKVPPKGGRRAGPRKREVMTPGQIKAARRREEKRRNGG